MIKVSIDSQVMQSVMSGVADQLKSKIDLNLDHVKKLCKEKYGIKTINGVASQNTESVTWNLKDDNSNEVSRGVYFYRFTSNDIVRAGKLVVR